MSITIEHEIVSWTNSNLAMLQEEYVRFVDQTNVEISFDTFCKQAFWQMPYTALNRSGAN